MQNLLKMLMVVNVEEVQLQNLKRQVMERELNNYFSFKSLEEDEPCVPLTELSNHAQVAVNALHVQILLVSGLY
jgi:hypothetical protein